jgi:hypothetical protein
VPFIWNSFLTYLKLSKNSKQKYFVYISMFYVPTKLSKEKKDFLYGLCKKWKKIGTKIKSFHDACFCLFCIGYEKYPFFTKLYVSM